MDYPCVVELNSGECITLLSEKDIPGIVGAKLSHEMSNLIKECLTYATREEIYAREKLNTDLDLYEDEISQLESDKMEALDITTEMLNYLNDTKKVDKQKLIAWVQSLYAFLL